jgi:hypothetical protein
LCRLMVAHKVVVTYVFFSLIASIINTHASYFPRTTKSTAVTSSSPPTPRGRASPPFLKELMVQRVWIAYLGQWGIWAAISRPLVAAWMGGEEGRGCIGGLGRSLQDSASFTSLRCSWKPKYIILPLVPPDPKYLVILWLDISFFCIG